MQRMISRIESTPALDTPVNISDIVPDSRPITPIIVPAPNAIGTMRIMVLTIKDRIPMASSPALISVFISIFVSFGLIEM